MNLTIMSGRLTRDPEMRYTQGDDPKAVTKYTLAVNRRGAKGQDADFINVTAFGKGAEFADKYFRQGQRVLISGHIQTGSYVNKEGKKINTFTVIADTQEFADSKKESSRNDDFVDDNPFLEGFQ